MAKKLDTTFKRIHFINHSHIDHTWWNAPAVCQERNKEIINRIIETCESDLDFRFSYETTAALMDYLEKDPDRKSDIESLLQKGCLDIGGLFVSANSDACSDEAIARNFYFGIGWLEKNLGYSPTLAKEYDTPGHTRQMPQLVKSAGMDMLVISRGPQGGFHWVGPDGSEVFTFCVPYNWSYWRHLGVGFEQTEERLPAELTRASGRYKGPELIIPDGDDMTLPNTGLTQIVTRWNDSYDHPQLAVSTLDKAMEVISKQKYPRRSGDMPNLWVVLCALHIEATQTMKNLLGLLRVAEMLHTLQGIHKKDFSKYPVTQIDSCWKAALLMADHNWGGKDRDSHGSEGDEHKDNLGGNALRSCQRLIAGGFNDLSYSLPRNENPEGMPVLVFNPLAWERDEAISIEISCNIPGLEMIEITDSERQSVPFAMEVIEKHKDDTILRARTEFLGRKLPSLGYSMYYVTPMQQSAKDEAVPQPGDRIIENSYYRVEFSDDGCCIRSLYDKDLQLELAGRFPTSAGPLEFEFGMFELFGIGLRLSVPDRSFFENPENEGTGESVDLTGEIWRAADYPATITSEHKQDFSKALIAEGTFIESRRRQKVVLYDDIKRIDLHVELDWHGKPDTVVYLQMPNALMHGQKYLGVPFGVHRDGDELAEFWVDENMPIQFKVRGFQDWLCFEQEGRGLAISTLWPIVDFTMVPAFPLMWTNNNSGFFFGERYRQIGKHSFAFSITSYEGTWQENRIHLWGKQLSNPPLTFLGESAPTVEKNSYVSVGSENIIVTALKKAQDDGAVIIRLYESSGQKTSTQLRTSFSIRGAQAVNLIEADPRKLACGRNLVELTFRPFEIKTIKLYI